jgi:hypothetical protein
MSNSAKIGTAVLPLPKAMRDSASVVEILDGGKTVTLKKGTSDMVCEYPQLSTLHSGAKGLVLGCYQEQVYAMVARASEVRRQLAAAGKTADDHAVDAQVEADIKAGKLKLPSGPTMGFRMAGPASGYDPATGTVSSDIHVWQMVVIPYTTGAKLSLPESQSGGQPWVMLAGTPMAHIMIDPDKTEHH